MSIVCHPQYVTNIRILLACDFKYKSINYLGLYRSPGKVTRNRVNLA